MKHYEIVMLVHPDRAERAQGICSQVGALVGDDGGRVHRLEDIGRRTLAYPVMGLQKAHYLLMNVECSSQMRRKVDEYLKFNEDVLRSLCVRTESARLEPSALLLQTRKERDRLARGSQQENAKAGAGAAAADEAKPDEAKPEEGDAEESAGEPASDHDDSSGQQA